jgi:hypothetical protein
VVAKEAVVVFIVDNLEVTSIQFVFNVYVFVRFTLRLHLKCVKRVKKA